MPITVAIVEDNAAVSASLERAIVDLGGYQCVCTCPNSTQALRLIPRHQPRVVIMDIELPDLSGIDCTARLKRMMPELLILVLTVYNDNEQIFKALAAGANGYLLKRSPPEDIIRAIHDVIEGGAPMSAEIARKVVQSFQKSVPSDPAIATLTPRETEILGLLAKGYASKEISHQLGIGYDTVCGHLGKIYGKLHVHSRTEAVIKYLQKPDGRT
jgi:DNA-binding NarL/FixJ family response regulator